MIQGIYIIKNKINNKFYIGSSININKRWNVHRCALNGQTHCNQHLQSAWNKYGEKNFQFKVVKKVDGDYETLLAAEQEYLDLVFKTCSDRIYNIAQKASGGNHAMTEKGKESISQKNRKFSDEQLEEIGRLFESGTDRRALSKMFDCTPNTMGTWINRLIKEGKIKDPVEVRKEKILTLHAEGYSQKQIANMTGYSHSSVNQLVKHGKYI